MYRGILLDVYGTLVRDTEDLTADIAAHLAALGGLDADTVEQDWTARLWAMADTAHGAGFLSMTELNTNSLAQTIAHFGLPADAHDLVRWDRPAPELYADALPFLTAVQVPVCLVSDADRDALAATLDRLGVPVEHVVTSEDARAYKPRPEPYEMALRRLGLTAADVLHVGDSPASDISGANRLGIDAAFVSRDGRPLPANLTAAHTVATLTELLPLIRGAVSDPG